MKIIKFEIWTEGYLCTGMEGIPATAKKNGEIEASSFQNACDLFFKNDKQYNKENLSYWACSLYDNKQDARKNFG